LVIAYFLLDVAVLSNKVDDDYDDNDNEH